MAPSVKAAQRLSNIWLEFFACTRIASPLPRPRRRSAAARASTRAAVCAQVQRSAPHTSDVRSGRRLAVSDSRRPRFITGWFFTLLMAAGPANALRPQRLEDGDIVGDGGAAHVEDAAESGILHLHVAGLTGKLHRAQHVPDRKSTRLHSRH